MNEPFLSRTRAIGATAALLALTVALSSCAKKAVEAARDVRPAATAYYQAQPGFFHFKSPADLPPGLAWHDGHDVPTFADPNAKRGGTLHAATPDFPATLRFYGADANSAFRPFILDDVAVSLLQRQPNTGQYYPGLAREWATDPDGRTMYFRLDPDARYSDGVPVRADDFLFAFFFFRSPNLNDPWSANFYSTNFTQITKYDDLTISVSWTEPKPDLEDRVGSLLPIPEHFYRDFGPDYPQRYQWQLEPTTGPYTVKPEDIHKGSSIDITRVPDWWAADKPYFRHRYNVDRVHFVVIRDPDKILEAFKRGDVDVVSATLPQTWYEKIPDSDPLVQRGAVAKATFDNEVPRPTYGLNLNCADPLLANLDIRTGIAEASNFDLIDHQYYRGDWVRMQTSADGYSEVPFPDIHPRPFSVEEAVTSFAKAGFTQRGPDGILVDAQGRRLSFTITTPYERMRDPLTILRQEAAKAGLELNLEILDYTTAFKKIDEKHHQIGFAAMNTGVEKYPRYWEQFDSSNANRPNTNNFTDTVDPEIDRLIHAYDKARTMDEIRGLARQLELRIRANAAFIPAFECPFVRTAYWRWVKFPPSFATRETNGTVGWNGLDFGLFWVDVDSIAGVRAAANGGAPLPPEIKVYEQWKRK